MQWWITMTLSELTNELKVEFLNASDATFTMKTCGYLLKKSIGFE